MNIPPGLDKALVPEALYVLGLQSLSPGGHGGLFKLLARAQLLHQLGVVALALILLEGSVYLVPLVDYNS